MNQLYQKAVGLLQKRFLTIHLTLFVACPCLLLKPSLLYRIRDNSEDEHLPRKKAKTGIPRADGGEMKHATLLETPTPQKEQQLNDEIRLLHSLPKAAPKPVTFGSLVNEFPGDDDLIILDVVQNPRLLAAVDNNPARSAKKTSKNSDPKPNERKVRLLGPIFFSRSDFTPFPRSVFNLL